MAAIIFRNFRVNAARGFSQVASKYRTRLLYDPTYRLASSAVDQYNKKKHDTYDPKHVECFRVVSLSETDTSIFGATFCFLGERGPSNLEFEREVSHVSHIDETSLIDAPISCLGSFAVDKYNKKEKANLKFVEVVDVNSYMVEGMSYNVTLKAKDGEKMNFYKANIWVRPWLNKEELTQFRLAVDPTNELACFAIDEYNKKENANLKFVKGIDSKRLSNDGFYHVTLEANDGEKVNVYQASIWERPCLNSEQLSEFHFYGEAPLLL